MDWVHKEDFIDTSGITNVVIVAYTSAQARLNLYQYLERLDRRALGNDHLTWRGGGGERVGGGGYVFFLKKYSDSHCCWKKYSDFGGGKKN